LIIDPCFLESLYRLRPPQLYVECCCTLHPHLLPLLYHGQQPPPPRCLMFADTFREPSTLVGLLLRNLGDHKLPFLLLGSVVVSNLHLVALTRLIRLARSQLPLTSAFIRLNRDAPVALLFSRHLARCGALEGQLTLQPRFKKSGRLCLTLMCEASRCCSLLM